MTYFYVVLIFHIVMAFTAFSVSFFIFSDHTSSNHKFLGMAWLSLCVSLLGQVYGIASADFKDAIFSNRIELVGLFFLNIFLFLFIVRMVESKVSIWLIYLMVLLEFAALMFLCTGDKHIFYYVNVEFTKVKGFPRLQVTYGVVAIFINAFNGILSTVNLSLILIDYFRNRRNYGKEMLYLSQAYLLSFLGVIYTMALQGGFLPYKLDVGFDPFYLIAFASLGFFTMVVFKYRIFDTISIAKEDVLKNVNEGLLIIDIGHKLLFVNETALELYPSLKDKKDMEATINELFSNNKKNITRGENTYYISVLPIYNKNRIKGYNIWIFDKTEEAKSTAKLLELKEAAEEASKAKSVFLANVSHEVRTPMNAIMGTAELMKREENSPTNNRYINDIINASNSLLSIIDDILDFSKIEKGKLEIHEGDYSLGQIIKEMTSILDVRLDGKDVSLIINVDETLPSYFYGDESHVRRIIVNLLNNAEKYTLYGKITLNVGWSKEEGDIADIRVSVEDTGIGIAKEDMERLFESFERAETARKSNIQGFGLGLAITKGLIESMDGEISVESEEGVGSTFSFNIKQRIVDYTPLGKLEDLKTKEGNVDDETFIAPQARVLLVDDNQVNLNVIKSLIDVYKIHCSTAISGEEALKKMSTSHYDMVFMDQMMPGMDGIETTRRIREMADPARNSIPIVALTANALEGVREMLLKNGFQDYVAKPMSIKVLEKVLKKYIPAEYIIYVDREHPEEILGRSIVIPDVDVEKGIENYGNSRTRYLSVLKYIYEDGAGAMRRMSNYMKDEDYNMLSYEVHAIKGLSAGIGADRITEEAKNLERACKEKDEEYIRKNYPLFIEKYAMLLANVKYVLNDNDVTVGGEGGPSDGTGEQLKLGDFRIYLRKLNDALEYFEQQEAAQIISELLKMKMSDELRNALDKVRSDIDEYEYDSAKERLSHIKKIKITDEA